LLSRFANNAAASKWMAEVTTKGKGERELEDFEIVFKALAHDSRRRILVVLNARGGKMTAGEIAERFHCSWPTTSRHLKVLLSAGLVKVNQHGREWIYELDFSRLKGTIGGWLNYF
jgi:DNA-binding transcriptional ArsR family regulator